VNYAWKLVGMETRLSKNLKCQMQIQDVVFTTVDIILYELEDNVSDTALLTKQILRVHKYVIHIGAAVSMSSS